MGQSWTIATAVARPLAKIWSSGRPRQLGFHVRQLRNAVSFVAACTGIGEQVPMALWLTWFALRRSIQPVRSAVKTLSFQGLDLCLDWASSEHVPVREVLIRGEYWPNEAFRPSPGQCVVDVGANAGVYAVYAGRQVGSQGRVIAIEPNPSVLNRLETNVRVNGLGQICTIVPAAVSSRTGRGSLMVGANSTIGYLVEPGQSGIDVPIRSLDEILRECAVDDIDLMKIDVEGEELAVLQSGPAAVRRCRRIAVEVSDTTGDDVAHELGSAGFDGVFRVDTGRGFLIFGERSPR